MAASRKLLLGRDSELEMGRPQNHFRPCASEDQPRGLTMIWSEALAPRFRKASQSSLQKHMHGVNWTCRASGRPIRIEYRCAHCHSLKRAIAVQHGRRSQPVRAPIVWEPCNPDPRFHLYPVRNPQRGRNDAAVRPASRLREIIGGERLNHGRFF